MRVLIVPDKFKGTLTAGEAAAAIASGWRKARPGDELELLPMSDGGDGFGQIVGSLLGATEQATATVNAAHEPIQAKWWWSERERTAIVESARVIGLAMLPPGKFHPFGLDTLGLGRLLLEISKVHANANLIVGIGGSATNDGGFGMARGLGFTFVEGNRAEIDSWNELHLISSIEKPLNKPTFASVLIATDVQNLLLGSEGATRIYGPQKGLTPSDFPIAERCLKRLADTVHRELGVDAENEPGTGAAGGLGYGLRVFLDGQFEPGFDIFARLAGLEDRIKKADLVVTGEGSIDASTQMGKGTGAVAKMAVGLGKRCLGLAGFAKDRGGVFTKVRGIHPDLTTIEEAMAQPGFWLAELSCAAAACPEIVHSSVVTSL
jgi:glycerate 2-kinase